MLKRRLASCESLEFWRDLTAAKNAKIFNHLGQGRGFLSASCEMVTKSGLTGLGRLGM